MGMLLAKEYYLRLEKENADLRTAVDKMDDIIVELEQKIQRMTSSVNGMCRVVDETIGLCG